MTRNSGKTPVNTRIYRDSRRLLDDILDATANFPRFYKYGIGLRMQDTATDMLTEIAAAYRATDKGRRIERLARFQNLYDTLAVLVRVAGDRRWISGTGRLARMVELMDAIGLQSSAWRRSLLGGEDTAGDTVPDRESHG